MATGFESYTVEIDDSGDWDGDTPVIGSGISGLTVLMVAPIEGCVLTPGDPSPIGRCPHTGELVYLDRPIDRIRLEAESLLGAVRAILPYAESRAEDMAESAEVAGFKLVEADGSPGTGGVLFETWRESRVAADKAVAAVDAAKALLARLDGEV